LRSPGGGEVQCEYDAEDQLVRYVDEAGAQTRLQYVGIGQIGKRLQADGHTVEYRYDSEEQLVAVINQRGERYELKRDALGRIVEEVDYWGQARRYDYDASGRLTATYDPLGQRIAYATDPLGRIVRKTLADVRQPGQQLQEHFVYDRRGQLVELRNPHRSATRRFDALGQLLEEVQDG
ncbi:RHS repeat protein, partial [Xanthomonas oryzae pv. oryzae]